MPYGTLNAGTIAPGSGNTLTIDGAWTAASQTCANLGTVTTADINGGTIDGSTIGASSHTTGKFTIVDSTTDFTIGGLVVTDGNIADTGTLAIVPVDGCTIALGSDAGDDFNVDSGKFVIEGDTGNCGIGTAAPANVLTVVGGADGKGIELVDQSGNERLKIVRDTASNTALTMYDASNVLKVQIHTATVSYFNGGNVGIGTAAPSSELHIHGTDVGLTIGYGTSAQEYYKNYFHGSSTEMRWYNGSVTASLTPAGAWTNASDERIKKDIADIEYGLDTVLACQPRKYKMVVGVDDLDQIGFVSQEMMGIIPEVVSGGEIDEETNEHAHYGMNYGALVAVAFKAIQELSAKNDALEARVLTLESA